jgi:hypothetical protein
MILAENVTHMFNVNWDSIKTYVNTDLLSFPAAGGIVWGGWSVLSKSGSYADGWGKGHHFFKKDSNQNIYFDKDLYNMSSITPSVEHVNFTDVVTDDIKSIVTQMQDLGFDPYRTRITRVPAGKSSVWHTDSESNTKKLRLHFVIDTNDNCFFEHKTKKIHLVERNVYIVNVNGLHRVTNSGTSDRIHIISDMTDNNKLSKLHSQ